MSAGAVIAIRRKQLVHAFRAAGATTRLDAVTLAELGQRHSWIFDQMVRQGVFIEVGSGRYYMNDAAATEFLSAKKAKALIITSVLLLIFAAVWLLGLLN